jgi:hypothetical protein
MMTDLARRVFVASDEFVACVLACAALPQNRWIALSPAAFRPVEVIQCRRDCESKL